MHDIQDPGADSVAALTEQSSRVGRSPGILCGTDFSVGARLGADAAGALARRRGVSLVLVHVVEQSLLNLLPAEMRKSLLDSSAERLDHEAARLREAGTQVEARFLVGASEELLVTEASAQGAALIVVSSMGGRAPVRWLIGSVAERVAEHATTPTWVVRDASPLMAWARGERPLLVLVAYDRTASAEAALQWVAGLRQTGPCTVVVAYADWPPEEQARFGSVGVSPLTTNPPEMQRLLERDVRQRAHAVLGEADVRVRVQANWGRPELCLADMAQAEGVDLVVTGAHQRHGLARWWNHSVSRGLLHHAPMSVVVVPTPATVPVAAQPIPTYRRVLAATDFSALGDQALPHAYATLPPGSTVRLVHVLPMAETPGTAEATRQLEARIPPDAAARGIVTEVAVRVHPVPGEAICQEAERFGADLICLGTHGHSGIAESLMGSVSRIVLTQGRHPVLLVRPPAP